MKNREESSTPVVGSPHSSISSDTGDSTVNVTVNMTSTSNNAHDSCTTTEGHQLLTENEEIQEEANQKPWVHWKKVLKLNKSDPTTLLQCEVCYQYFETDFIDQHIKSHSKNDRLTIQQQQQLMGIGRPSSTSLNTNAVNNNVMGHDQERESLNSRSHIPHAVPIPNPIRNPIPTPSNSINNSYASSSSEERKWSRSNPYNNIWPNFERQSSYTPYNGPAMYNSQVYGTEYGLPFNNSQATSAPYPTIYDNTSPMTQNYQFGQHQHSDWSFSRSTQPDHFVSHRDNSMANAHSWYPHGQTGHSNPYYQNMDLNYRSSYLNVWPQAVAPYPTPPQHLNYSVMEPRSLAGTSNHPSFESSSLSTDHQNYRQRVEDLEIGRRMEQENPPNPMQGEPTARTIEARDNVALPPIALVVRQPMALRPTDRMKSEHEKTGMGNSVENATSSTSTPSHRTFLTIEHGLNHLREHKYPLKKQRRHQYICPYCLQPFETVEALKKHHNAQRPRPVGFTSGYFCEFCILTFGSGQEVLEHLRRTHNIFRTSNSRFCHKCGKRVNSQGALNSHAKTHGD